MVFKSTKIKLSKKPIFEACIIDDGICVVDYVKINNRLFLSLGLLQGASGLDLFHSGNRLFQLRHAELA